LFCGGWRGRLAQHLTAPNSYGDFDPLCRLHRERAATTFSRERAPPDARGAHDQVKSPVVPRYWRENSSRKNKLNR
jgi:hypothetical protein